MILFTKLLFIILICELYHKKIEVIDNFVMFLTL